LTLSHLIDLTTLTPSQGFAMLGEAADDHMGFQVSAAGDINGDGYDDVIVGADGVSANGSSSGSAYVIFGGPGISTTTVGGRSFIDPAALIVAQGFVIEGGIAFNRLGSAVSTAGDVNGDGFDDLVVGAYNEVGTDFGVGASYVIFGTSKGFGTVVDGRQVLNVGLLSAAEGFVLLGAVGDDNAGARSVTSAGDVNGDGYDDMIIGAPGNDDGGTQAGEAYVVFGSHSGFGTTVGDRQVVDLATLSASQGFVMGGETQAAAGWSVASAGDVNGDGFADMVIGATYDSGSTGTSYVVFGTDQGFGSDVSGRQVIDLATLSSSTGFTLSGGSSGDLSGWSVSSAGDLNGDGFDDIVVGARSDDDGGNGAGSAYVIFGTDQGFGTETAGQRVVDLDTLAPSAGFLVLGATAGDTLGFSVASAGDVNGDGLDDLIVGAYNASETDSQAGAAYVVFGQRDGFGDTIGGRQRFDLSDLSLKQGFAIGGDDASDNLGWSVSSAGDINGDGFSDLIVGTYHNDDNGSFAGASYVVYGGRFGDTARAVRTIGTTAAEILIGGAANDVLDGRGGGDIFRSGAGNDKISVLDGQFEQIDGGHGRRDQLVMTSHGATLDGRNFSNDAISGIEAINLTGDGRNRLILDASDLFHFSDTGNSAFTAADSHNNLVVYGNADDRLQFIDYASFGAEWALDASDKTLAGKNNGTFDFYNLVDGDGAVLASVAVDADVALI
jgi:hypothetical protein